MCGRQQRIAKAIMQLTLVWVLMSCTYPPPPHLRPAPVESPPPIEIKPDTPASEIPVPETSKLSVYSHKVRWPKETLSHIARWYTGTIKNWKAIAKVNPDLNPKKIKIGDTIYIPEDLLTLRKPMPRSFVGASVQKKAVPLSSSKKILIPLESTKLFGPIESEPLIIETDSSELFRPIETEQSSIEPDTAKLFGPIE